MQGDLLSSVTFCASLQVSVEPHIGGGMSFTPACNAGSCDAMHGHVSPIDVSHDLQFSPSYDAAVEDNYARADGKVLKGSMEHTSTEEATNDNSLGTCTEPTTGLFFCTQWDIYVCRLYK